MNCGICKSYLAYSRGVPEEKAECLIVRAVFLETKTVSLREDAKNWGETKSNPVMNTMLCPVKILIVWIGVTEDVMV